MFARNKKNSCVGYAAAELRDVLDHGKLLEIVAWMSHEWRRVRTSSQSVR